MLRLPLCWFQSALECRKNSKTFLKPNSSALTGVLSTKQGQFWWRSPSVCTCPCGSISLFHVCSEGTAAVRRKWLQPTRDPAVHLGPEVSGHGSAGNHPREEHGHPAPAADQQVTRLRCRVTPSASMWPLLAACLFRILGNRVAELEKKFQTLETSGLWSLPGKYSYHNTSFPGSGCTCGSPFNYWCFLLLSSCFSLRGGLTYNVSMGINGSMSTSLELLFSFCICKSHLFC